MQNETVTLVELTATTLLRQFFWDTVDNAVTTTWNNVITTQAPVWSVINNG